MAARPLNLKPKPKAQQVEAQIYTFRQKRRPGPPGADAPLAPEKDLEDAALIVDLVQNGSLHVEGPKATAKKASIKRTSRRLTLEDEIDLARRVQEFGDVDARNTLVMANMGLVHLVANQYFRPPLRYEDLLQEGTMGLIRATETFEPSRSVRFSTYSVYWIRAKIQRLIQRIEKDDIPGIIGASSQDDASGKRRKPRARKLSIERTLEEEDSRTLSEVLPTNTENPEKLALKQEREQNIQDILDEIVEELGDPRLRTIIEWRLLAEEPETLSSLGARLQLSREGARLLESKMIALARQRLSSWRRGS